MCTVLTDLLAWFCWNLINMYIARWCMSEKINFFEISIGSCKLCNLPFFANKLVCMDLTALYINQILLKIDIHVRYTMINVCNNLFIWKHYWYLQIYVTYNFCKYICVHDFGWYTNPILLKIDILVCHTMIHVWNNRFFKITIW